MDLANRAKVCWLRWIRRAIENPGGSAAAGIRKILKEDNISLALLSKRKPEGLGPAASPFYVQILKTWFALHNFQPQDEDEVRGECLWNNILISSPNNILVRDQWRGWAEAGVSLVHHLCHSQENRLMGHQEIKEKFNINCNFLQALTIRQSVPNHWRSLITAGFSRQISNKFLFDINDTHFDLLNSSPKSWYRQSVKKLATPFSRGASWMRELNLQTQPDWEQIWILPYRTSRETKLQSFAYKVAYRLIPCNKYLNTIRISESPDCPLCGDIDSLSHFFYDCDRARTFWTQLSRWCETYIDISLSHLSALQILLGVTDKVQNAKIINWILLVTKFYLQRQRLFHDAQFSLVAFLTEVRTRLLTERRACYLENKPNKFKTWRRLLLALG